MSEVWSVEPCHACQRLLRTEMLMVTWLVRQPDHSIGIATQALGKFCDQVCLAAWAVGLVRSAESTCADGRGPEGGTP
jgi:hypothetical protein